MVMNRRSLVRASLGTALAAPVLRARAQGGVTDTAFTLGMSAAFSGPSRGLGIELYRGASAYFGHVNDNGGIGGRQVALTTYDDGYQPDPSVRNTVSLMLEDDVFLLFGYVGTPTVTRVLPLLKKFQERNVYLFFPFTGAQPQREPPYGEFAFNLRASYRQETAGLVDNFVDSRAPTHRGFLPSRCVRAEAAGPAFAARWPCTARRSPARPPTGGVRDSRAAYAHKWRSLRRPNPRP